MTDLNPRLTELSLDALRRRRSAKWAKYPEDVLPAWVAEMDFPLAPPVEEALAEAVRAGDTGYAAPAELGLGEAFAGFAAARLGWRVDPAAVSPPTWSGRLSRCWRRSPTPATGSSSTPPSTTRSSR